MTAEKEGRQSLVAASNCNNSTSRLYVTDRLTKLSFLVDTGANFCVYPRSRLRERQTQTSYKLFAANGTTVHTYGCITLRLDFGLRRVFSWRFVVAEVTEPIIGSDFLLFLQPTRQHEPGAISTTSRRELSSFLPARQFAEGNSLNSDRNI